jgi:Lipoprotein LpqB beta-propeller domain/Sporulation and spore germination
VTPAAGPGQAAAVRPAWWRRPGAGSRVATAAVAAAIAAGGCAAVPTSGAVQQFGAAAQAGVGPPGDYPQPIVQGPGPGWTPEEIVAGFLAANASFANNHAVAREYLDPTKRQTWSPGWAVDVVSSPQVSAPISVPKEVAASQPGEQEVRVAVTGVRVATLNDKGQSLPSSGSPKQKFTFTLGKFGDQWRISTPPPSLLLTQDAFQRVYQPRNLYFLAGSGQTLVPDPVFVPEPDTTTDLAFGLATALLQNPIGWLGGAAVTGFPAKSAVVGVKINGPNAIVDLGGKAAASPRDQEQMAAQLAWTLASGQTSIQAVELEVNGRPLQIRGNQLQLPDAYSSWMPTPLTGSSLYYLDTRGAVRALSGIGAPGSGNLGKVTAVTGAAGTPSVPPLQSIAVSPDGRWIAGISAGGKKVYAWDLTHKTALRVWPSCNGTCTSLSWDQQGDLWITAGGGLWMMAPGSDGAQPVRVPPGDTVTGFRVAPDGVRAVMIVNNGAPLQLVAIVRSGGPVLGTPVAIGSGITDPESLSWYDANNVIVLDGSSSGGQLDEVPLNGGQFTPIASEGDIVSVTATNPSGPAPNIAVGLANGQIMVSSNLGAFEGTRATGTAPVFPG